MTNNDVQDLHECGEELSEDDEVLINDRSRALTVTGMHDRERKKKYRRQQGDYTVIHLSGNGTEYHLLCWENASHGPMLYMESEWETEEQPDEGTRYEYPRGGTRVSELRIL